MTSTLPKPTNYVNNGQNGRMNNGTRHHHVYYSEPRRHNNTQPPSILKKNNNTNSNNTAALRTVRSRESTLDKNDVYATTSYQQVKQDERLTSAPAARVHVCPRSTCQWIQCLFLVLIPMLVVTSLAGGWLIHSKKVGQLFLLIALITHIHMNTMWSFPGIYFVWGQHNVWHP